MLREIVFERPKLPEKLKNGLQAKGQCYKMQIYTHRKQYNASSVVNMDEHKSIFSLFSIYLKDDSELKQKHKPLLTPVT